LLERKVEKKRGSKKYKKEKKRGKAGVGATWGLLPNADGDERSC